MSDIAIPLGQINANTNLYLATTGSDTTGDGSQGNPWLTLNKAYSWLSSRRIMNGSQVNINMAAGTYTPAQNVNLNHPDGQYIAIIGADYLAYSMTSIVSAGAQSALEDTYHKYRDYVIQVSSVTNIVAGDYVIVNACAGGTNPLYMPGCHEVRSVDGVNTRITIRVYHIHANAASGAVTGKVTVLKTMINTGSYSLLINNNNTLGYITKIALMNSGARSQYAIYVQNGALFTASPPFAICKSYGASLFNQGQFYSPSASINGTTMSIVVSGCTYGVYAVEASLFQAQYAIFNGGYTGPYIVFGSHGECYGCISTGNYAAGLDCISKSSIAAQSSTIVGNNMGTSGTGAYCLNHSMIYVNSCTLATNFLDYSPALNTEGNVMSINTT
jgi:hypothetical protein